MTIRIPIRALAAALLIPLVAVMAMAEGEEALSQDEEVRRIVERAQAAVALAEAQATRKIAQMQITLLVRDSEIQALRRQMAQWQAAQEEAAARADSAEAAWRRVREENRALRASSGQLVSDVGTLSDELKSNTSLMENAQSMMDRLSAERDALSDSASRMQALLNRQRAENEELRKRIDGLHTRTSLLEQSLEEAEKDVAAQKAVAEKAAASVKPLEKRAAEIATALKEEKDRADREARRLEAAGRRLSDSLAVAMKAAAAVPKLESELRALSEELEKAEARALAERFRADSTIVAERDRWTADVRERNDALANRAKLLEAAMREAREKAAAAEKTLADRLQGIADSEVALVTLAAAREQEARELRERTEAWKSRSQLLDRNLREATERAAALERELASVRDLVTETTSAYAGLLAMKEKELAELKEYALPLRERVIELDVELAKSRAAQKAAEIEMRGARGTLAESVAVYSARLNVQEQLNRELTERAAALSNRADRLERSYHQARAQALSAEEKLGRFLALTTGADSYAAFIAEHDALKTRVALFEAESSVAIRDRNLLGASLKALQEKHARLEAGAALLRIERDSLVAEMVASRREMIEAIRTLSAAESAVMQARRERDLALAGTASRPGSGAAADEAARMVLYERELAALRQVLADVTVGAAPVEAVKPPAFVIEIPATPVTPAPIPAPPPVGEGLDLATASFETLASIPEIGEARARAILWYRSSVGPVKSIKDLKSVPGFNDERMEAVKKYFAGQEE